MSAKKIEIFLPIVFFFYLNQYNSGQLKCFNHKENSCINLTLVLIFYFYFFVIRLKFKKNTLKVKILKFTIFFCFYVLAVLFV